MALNQVEVLRFYLDCDDEAFGFRFNNECERLMDTVLPAIIEEELQPYLCPDEYIHIPLLEVEVGSVDADRFIETYPQRFRAALKEALSEQYRNNQQWTRRSENVELWEAWKDFLLTGRIPNHFSDKIGDLEGVFADILHHHADVFKKFLRQYGHRESLQHRLVYQLTDTQLREIVRVVQPEARDFIISYSEALINKYRKADDRGVSESNYRQTVWTVILSYLLTDRSSYFDKKTFIRWTIGRLAATYNTTYRFILDELTRNLYQFLKQSTFYPDLVLLLEDLQKESSKKLDLQPQRSLLIRILSDSDSRRTYLAQMSEPAIRQLVYILVKTPADAHFVIHYADILDKQRNAMVGQRAGKEFSMLKWHLIFPLLTTSTVTHLNKRYFVHAVIRGIAAHYNLNVLQVVEWLYMDIDSFPIQADVHDIIKEWYGELTRSPFLMQTEDEGSSLFRLGVSTEWISRLRDPNLRPGAIAKLESDDHTDLLNLLFPTQQQFVTAYARSLDRLRTETVFNSLKVDSRWETVKWGFLYGVLFEMQHQVFNKKYVVLRVIQQLSAHYNLRITEVLIQLRTSLSMSLNNLSFDLIAVIDEIHDEYLPRVEMRTNKEVIRILTKHYGDQIQLIKWFDGISFTKTFLAKIEYLITLESALYHQLKRDSTIRYKRDRWLDLLKKVAQYPHQYSAEKVLTELLAMIHEQIRTSLALDTLRTTLQKLAKKDTLLANYLREDVTYFEEEQNPSDFYPSSNSRFIHNAGLVILAPFFSKLFVTAGLLDDHRRSFKDRPSQIKAIFMLQYAAYGEKEFPEFEMELNKLLTGFKTGVPIPRHLPLSSTEKGLVAGMLNGVLQHWNKLSNSSIETLRVSFLQRNGRLYHEEERLHLNVESQPYDMLLDSLPWKFNIIRHAWMESGIYTTWR